MNTIQTMKKLPIPELAYRKITGTPPQLASTKGVQGMVSCLTISSNNPVN
jgi:hypothetical protein